MNKFDLQISDNMWANAYKLEAEYHAALRVARAFDVKHDLPWPCDIPVAEGGGTGWRPCGVRGLCPHVD